MESVIRVKNLVKEFGSVKAVNGISFEVRRGEVFGLLGPNGAGKTTTLDIIEGLQKPSAGHTFVFGIDTQKESGRVKQRIGVQLQASAYFEQLRLKEILKLFGEFYNKAVKPEEILATVDLADKANATVGTLSDGQKQRFTIAAALVNDPEIIFLDEPTTGLDPQARRSLWDFIRRIHQEGRTVVLTTHYMDEAQTLCERVAIIDLGRVASLDTPINLIRNLATPYQIKLITSARLPVGEMRLLEGVKQAVEGKDGSYLITCQDANKNLSSLLSWVNGKGAGIEHIEVVPSTLEDVFLTLTGKQLKD